MNLLRRSTVAALLVSAPALSSGVETPLPAPGASERIDAIRNRGTLRVAVLDEYPWLKRTPGGPTPFIGPAWSLAAEYARRLGVTIETVPVGFADKVSILAADRVDITIAPLLVTPEREKTVDLISYSVSGQCLFGLAGNPKVAEATSIDDLDRADVTIAVTIGSPQAAWLMRRLPAVARLGVAGSIADVRIDEIVSRRADVASIDKFFFAGLAQRVRGLVSVPRGAACLASGELPIPIAMAVAREQPVFLAWLRAANEVMKPKLVAEEANVTKGGS